jgi:hypothetical protein
MTRSWVVAVWSMAAGAIACSGGGEGGSGSTGSATQVAADFCARVCACSSTCTVATVDASGQPKDPTQFGSQSACEMPYQALFSPADAGLDLPGCSAAIPNATCATDAQGAHYLVPPAACRRSVLPSDAGSSG